MLDKALVRIRDQATIVESIPSTFVTDDDDLGECSICLCPMETGEEVIRLACGHAHHHGCLAPWLGRNDTCPMCKRKARSAKSMGEIELQQFMSAPTDAGNDLHDYPPPAPAPLPPRRRAPTLTIVSRSTAVGGGTWLDGVLQLDDVMAGGSIRVEAAGVICGGADDEASAGDVRDVEAAAGAGDVRDDVEPAPLPPAPASPQRQRRPPV